MAVSTTPTLPEEPAGTHPWGDQPSLLIGDFRFFFFFFLAALCSLRDLSSPTRDRTRALGSESAES